MKIAVCIKLVPATTAQIKIAANGQGLDLAGTEMVLSPYDEYALEAALQWKDKHAGSTVLAVAVGGDSSGKILEHAIAVGGDEITLVKAPEADALNAARCAHAALKAFAPDVVFCGRQAIDDDQWGFPGALAELLDWPHLTAASALDLGADAKSVTAQRLVTGGVEHWTAQLPAVISCDKGLNTPRVPTLKGRMNAKKKQPAVKTPADLGLADAQTRAGLKTISYTPPPSKSAGKQINLPPAEAAAEVLRWLKNDAKAL
jgi:electron transfer flavoprotein beta subunit